MVVVVVVVYLSIYLSYLILSYPILSYLILSYRILSIYLSIYLSLYLHPWKRSYSARRPQFFNLTTSKTQRDIVNFWTWQRQKRDKSARLPHFSKLTTSKTKQFCETSFKNGKLSAELTGSCQCVLRLFHSICLKYCACHEKWGQVQVMRSAAPVTQNYLSKPEGSQEVSALTSEHLWWTCLLYFAWHAKCIFALPMSHACQRF